MEFFTVGHSDHTLDKLIDLLRGAGVAQVVDVRARPGSRRHPQFGRESLEGALTRAGIGYAWLGDLLGGLLGKPFATDTWRELRALPRFQAGIDRLKQGFPEPCALLCAERDPLRCHRFWAIGEELAAQGIPVRHLLADGMIVDHTALVAQSEAAQLDLI